MVRLFLAVLCLLSILISCQAPSAAPKVTACFTVYPDSPTDINLAFDPTCSQNANTYLWYYNNNKVPFATEGFPSGNPALAGKQTVLLVVSDGGSTDSMRKYFYVTPTKPHFYFTSVAPFISDTYFPVDTPVTFDGSNSFNVDTTKLSWTIPDGTKIFILKGKRITYSWVNKGHYAVKLSGYNPSNTLSNDTTFQIDIH